MERYYRRVVAFPSDTPAGALNDETLATLMAVTRVLLPAAVHWPRYEAQFRWRAGNRDGYRDLYERCAAALDAIARSAGHARFTAAERSLQQRIVDRFADVRAMILERRTIAALRIALFEPEWLLFERYITRDVIALFAQTDAWLIAGYPSHPGVARGLEEYREPVRFVG